MLLICISRPPRNATAKCTVELLASEVPRTWHEKPFSLDDLLGKVEAFIGKPERS